LLIYEIQQTSDITYRVYDWGRPETETRKLHIDKAVAVSNPRCDGVTAGQAPQMEDGEVKTLTQCQYFSWMRFVEEENCPLGDGGRILSRVDRDRGAGSSVGGG
jgi:mannose-6-phosphate isomerase